MYGLCSSVSNNKHNTNHTENSTGNLNAFVINTKQKVQIKVMILHVVCLSFKKVYMQLKNTTANKLTIYK